MSEEYAKGPGSTIKSVIASTEFLKKVVDENGVIHGVQAEMARRVTREYRVRCSPHMLRKTADELGFKWEIPEHIKTSRAITANMTKSHLKDKVSELEEQICDLDKRLKALEEALR